MQISDMMNQYNRNTATGATATSPQQGVQELVSAVRAMTVGNVFEGTVNEMKHGQVQLALSNGQTVMAKVAPNVKLTVGQPMFFQVKSNNGTAVEIKPFTNGNLQNPTLLKALDAAGISADVKTIEMVDAMMEEQMPIDRKSLQDMARTLSGFGNADIRTMVQMTKLDIPLTQESFAQFMNYKSDQAAITGQFDEVLNSLGQIYLGEDMTENMALELGNRIYSILEQGQPDAPQQAGIRQQELNAGAVLQEVLETDGKWTSADTVDAIVRQIPQEDMWGSLQTNEPEESSMPVPQDGTVHTEQGVRYYPLNSLGALLDADALGTLTNQLQQLGISMDNPNLFEDGELKLSMKADEFLKELHQLLNQKLPDTKDAVRKLFSGNAYQSLLQSAAEEQWLLKPQEVSQDKIKNLYHKLEAQMHQMQEMVRESGQERTPLAKAVNQLQGNIEFMNQISQAYHYVQLPLKMSGQRAQSDLYVYTNKKNAEDKDGDLTAFLHLDMEHLGSTDVSVRMHESKVHTDFFLEDDRSFALIQKYSRELVERLNRKGYECSVNVENHEHRMNLVEDFMKKDQPSGGILHRYSFDMRA